MVADWLGIPRNGIREDPERGLEEYSEVEVKRAYQISEHPEASSDDFEAAYNSFPRSTTTTPQATVGFGKSRFGVPPEKLKTLRHEWREFADDPDEDGFYPADCPPKLLYRQDDELLYRFDTREPDEIFREGFKPLTEKVPASLRFYEHTLHSGDDGTAFVSTTRSPWWGSTPDWFQRPDSLIYRYVIKAPGGIDLMATLGAKSLVKQQEVVFWKGIRPEYIDRLEIVNSKGEIVDIKKRSDWNTQE
ncbi:hypothetical protein ACIBEA_21790 [Streptomyces sp. NPDC051555]|uniref:scabin-related ADP-ribosyltransferase n=1 Tax=Streptomyces sp. NPDC051555 TaxID=3365657 RepID=UPI0037A8E927